MQHIPFIVKFMHFFQIKKEINFQMFVIHLNCHTLKTFFSPPNSSNQNDFFNEIGLYTFFLLYLWAKYEPIWTDFTGQTVILGANLLVKA